MLEQIFLCSIQVDRAMHLYVMVMMTMSVVTVDTGISARECPSQVSIDLPSWYEHQLGVVVGYHCVESCWIHG